MKIIVIDGQGGGLGRSIVERLKAVLPEQRVIALGTNALATAAMLRAGADGGATGENAIRFNCLDADIILGPAGILIANAMLGEMSPGMVAAVSASPAQKIVIPSERCGMHVIGVRGLSMDEAVAETAALVKRLTTEQ